MAKKPLSPDAIDSLSSGPAFEQAIHVWGGLSVYGLDGQLLGRVDEFIIDAAGNLTGFVVRTGNSLQRELRLLMDWIQSSNREQIQLRITADEARIVGQNGNAMRLPESPAGAPTVHFGHTDAPA
jgi:hypothetical protein